MLERKERNLNSIDVLFKKKKGKTNIWRRILRAGEHQKGKTKKEA